MVFWRDRCHHRHIDIAATSLIDQSRVLLFGRWRTAVEITKKRARFDGFGSGSRGGMGLIGGHRAENHVGISDGAGGIFAPDGRGGGYFSGLDSRDTGVAVLFDIENANVSAAPAFAQARSSLAKANDRKGGSVLLGHG